MTVILIFTLALGIGSTTAIFSMVNAVLLRGLPFKDPDRLVTVWLNNLPQGYKEFYLSAPDFVDFRDQNRVFEAASVFITRDFTLTGQGEPMQITASLISANFFSLLGSKAILGRTFLAGDDEPGHDHVVVLSYGLWQSRFGSDPSMVGKALTLNDTIYTVVGVMPQGFDFPPYFDLQGGIIPWQLGVWVPLDVKARFSGDLDLANRGALSFIMLARLKPGTTLEAAQSNLDAIDAGIQQRYPESSKGWGVAVVPLAEQMAGSVRRALLMLLGAVGLLLLIACGNAASLLLAKASGREKEIAIRAALGARRSRILRQLLTESVVTGILAGMLGLAMAYAATPLLVAAAPVTVPRIHEAHVDGWVLCFVLAISLLTGLVFGLAPALQASRPNISGALVEGGRSGTGSLRSQRFRGALVVGEISLALVLLVAAGLMMRSFLALESVHPGFNVHGLVTLQMRFNRIRYPEERQRAEFSRQLLQRVKALPGVQSVATIDLPPLNGAIASWTFNVEGQPPLPAAERPIAEYHSISPGYFKVMGIPLLKGRDFTEGDTGNSKVAIINETLAHRFFPGEDPVGKRINLVDPPAAPVWREIVGVAGDVRYTSVDTSASFDIYALNQQSYSDFPTGVVTLVIRTGVGTGSVAAAVRSQVQDIDKEQAIALVRTMDEYVSRSLAKPRLYVVLLDLFSFLALALAALGIYGVVSYVSTQRVREIGIRMALGARPRDVLRLILRQGAVLAAVGVAGGLLVSFVLTRVMASLLYEVSNTDPLVFTAVPLFLAAVSLASCYLPARRAAKTNPMTALRHE